MVKWLLIFFGASLLVSPFAFSQETIYYQQGSSFREYSGCPGKLCPHYSMTSWDQYYDEFAAWKGNANANNATSFMNFRVIFPLNYDANREEPYPIIVMLHGAGESGRKWTNNYDYEPDNPRYDNNGHNLLHGGNEHRLAVQRNPSASNAFPGIVVFPQATYNGTFGDITTQNLSQGDEYVVRFLEEQIVGQYNGDINRIYAHGLSNGARMTWGLAIKRPDMFAAIHPMSGAPYNMDWAADRLITIPMRVSQGGTDSNPNAGFTQQVVDHITTAGASIELIYFPTLGHGTWVATYGRDDFFSWLLDKDKRNIHVFGGEATFCGAGSVRLGFSKGMTSYQWKRNGTPIGGATNWDYTATQQGTYTVEFTRPNGISYESFPQEITQQATSSYQPELTVTGSTYLPLLYPTGALVQLVAPAGYSQYTWYKDGAPLSPPNSNTRIILSGIVGSQTHAGSYAVKVRLNTGCDSDFSNPVVFTYGNDPLSGSITNVSATAIAADPSTKATITWTETVPDEDVFEIWRHRGSAGSVGTTNGYLKQAYKLVGTVPANTTTFTDNGLTPGAQHLYIIRAVNTQGNRQSNAYSYTGPQDQIPPTAPLNLTASDITSTQVTLSWNPAADNHQVYKYQIFNGSELVWTVSDPDGYLPTGAYNSPGSVIDVFPPPPTTYTVTDLAPGTTYFFSVRALDFVNPNTDEDNLRNYSPLSEALEVTTQSSVNGLQFKYYTHSGLSGSNPGNQLAEPYIASNGPNFNFANPPASASGDLEHEGVVSNFDISGANTFQNTSDPSNFVYAFDGFLQVPQAGNYRFFTRSDDGSRLYLDAGNDGTAELQINNDGAQGATNVNTGSIPLTTGVRYKIRGTYFENGGGNEFFVRYTYSSGGTPSTNYNNGGNIPDSWLYQSGTIVSTYYLKADAEGNDPTLNTAWTTSSTGIGGTTAPAGVFTTENANFVLANLNNAHPTLTISNPWTIGGNGSKVIVGDGAAFTLNLNAAVTAKMDAAANATINVNNATVPAFNVLDAGSMVNFNTVPTGGNLPGASYGNVSLAASGQYNLPFSTTTVKGNLTIANGVTTTGVVKNLTTLRVGGNLTINNTSGNPFPAASDQRYSLVFTGGTTHTVNFITPVDPSLFSIQTDFGDVVNFTGVSGRTFTVGSSQGGGLVLEGSSTLNMGNNSLVISGRGTINPNNETGTLFMDGGSLTFNSTATQNSSIYFADNSRVANLTSSTPTSNQLSLLANVDVDNLVTVSSGQLNANEGNLTLRSVNDSGTGTARIGPLLNGANVSGKIKVQRYMSGEGRIYRYISSPVENVSVEDLQEFFPITGNFNGASEGPGINSGNASMFSYSETSNPQYRQFPSIGGNTQETLQPGVGYVPYIREGSEPTVIEYVGEANQGNITFTLTGNAANDNNLGWNLLGNPYPAPIRWNGTQSSVNGWPTLNGVNSVVYVRENISATETAVRTSNGAGAGDLVGDVIAPGQSFWVRTTASSPNLIISESAKQTTDGAFYREGPPVNTVKIKMSSANLHDATYIQWHPAATSAFDTEMDGVKLDNTFFNLSSLTADNKAMAINLTTTDYCEQEVKLRITNAAAGSYSLDVTGVSSIISQDKVTFTDSFTQTEIMVTDALNYPFSITADAASKADGRFTLRFEKPEVVLNQKLATEAACEQNSPIVLVSNSQPGVTYQAFHNGVAVSAGVMSTGGSLQVPVNPALVGIGATEVNIKAGFTGCNSYDLPMTIAVQRDSLPVPMIIAESAKLVANTENATYQWYLNGTLAEEQTGREWLNPDNGKYVVEVFKGTCLKVSDTLVYVITSLERPNRLYQLYPNPTRDKFIVTLEEPIDFASLRITSIMGQTLPVKVNKISEYSAEVDMTKAQTGLYVVLINRQRYKIIRE